MSTGGLAQSKTKLGSSSNTGGRSKSDLPCIDRISGLATVPPRQGATVSIQPRGEIFSESLSQSEDFQRESQMEEEARDDCVPLASGGHTANNDDASTRSLILYFREVMRETQEEFRRELGSIRDSINRTPASRSTPAASDMHNTARSTPQEQSSNLSLSFPKNLKDWNVSYDGTGSVADFLFKVDTLTERSRCPHDYLMANFQVFLSGKADDWYWFYTRQNPDLTYPTLKIAMTREFGTLESDHEVILRISTRRQHAKESFDDYHAVVVHMNQRLKTPMTDSSMIEIMKKNVYPDLRTMLFISDPKDLGELRDLARKAEKVLQENRSQMTHAAPRARQVNEIRVESDSEEYEEETDPQVEALRVTRLRNDYSGIKCWNCLQMGHSYIYCPDEPRHTFCFKCGQRGVTTPKCDNSHSENRRRSERLTGDPRSVSQIPSRD